MRLAIRGVLVLMIGCHSSSPASPDAMIDGPPPDVAVAYTAPQIPDLGGPVLDTPAIVTVTWPSDALAADLHTFDDWFTHSGTWVATLGQYRIKAGLPATTWTVPTPAPATIDDAELQVLLRDAIEHGTLVHSSASTLYAIYPPATTTVTETFGSAVYRSCETFGGYHGTASLTDGTPIYYAVAARCAPQAGLDQLDTVTWAASHELAEAATDPDANHPAWRMPYDPATLYLSPYGGEIGDLCLGYPLHVENHVITALYSNAAAAAGQRTCVPAPPGPMYAAISDPHELAITAGHSADLAISIVSPVAVDHLHFAVYSIPQGVLTITPASSTVAAGDHLTVHVGAPASTPPGGYNVVMNVSDGGYSSVTYAILTAQ
jgi:hypothetical protein